MPEVEKLVIDEKNELVSWRYLGRCFSKVVPGLEQAIIDLNAERILVLYSVDGAPSDLMTMNAEGEVTCELSAPDGFQFYYLSNHPDLGGAVVCTTNQPINGWSDWFFGIDLSLKALVRHCPAY